MYIAATFLFGLNYKEKHHLSQTVTNFTVVYVNELVGITCKQLECSIQQVFQENETPTNNGRYNKLFWFFYKSSSWIGNRAPTKTTFTRTIVTSCMSSVCVPLYEYFFNDIRPCDNWAIGTSFRKCGHRRVKGYQYCSFNWKFAKKLQNEEIYNYGGNITTFVISIMKASILHIVI